MFFDLMAVMIRMSTGIQLLVYCYNQGEAISTDDILSCNLSLHLSKSITVLKIASSASALLVMSRSIRLIV